MAKHAAKRGGDLSGRKRARRDLVEQWLKKVIVSPISVTSTRFEFECWAAESPPNPPPMMTTFLGSLIAFVLDVAETIPDCD